VDWYEAWADLGGERTSLQEFVMRSMGSGAAFHYFGGAFRLLRYDNLASAVRKILRGHRREETVWFIAFRSHWRFAAEFLTPGEGHEKGGVEGKGGYFRRNHFVPVPCVADLGAEYPAAEPMPRGRRTGSGWARGASRRRDGRGAGSAAAARARGSTWRT
jgi:hypothetical protein